MIIALITSPITEKVCPFTIFRRYPATPNPDNIKSNVHDQPFPLYNPNETIIEAVPRMSKNIEPISRNGAKGDKIIKETEDIANKINPLITVSIVIMTIPKGVFFFLVLSISLLFGIENITLF
jgi:hypothetical protein